MLNIGIRQSDYSPELTLTRIHQQRRSALRNIADLFDTDSALAKQLKISRAYLSQLIGTNPTRTISDATWLKFNRRLRKFI